jgi:hypothetical protein
LDDEFAWIEIRPHHRMATANAGTPRHSTHAHDVARQQVQFELLIVNC